MSLAAHGTHRLPCQKPTGIVGSQGHGTGDRQAPGAPDSTSMQKALPGYDLGNILKPYQNIVTQTQLVIPSNAGQKHHSSKVISSRFLD